MKYRELRPMGCVSHIVTKGAVDVRFVQNNEDAPALAVESDDTDAVRSVKTLVIGNRLMVEGGMGNPRYVDGSAGVPGTVTAETSADDRLLFPPRKSPAMVDVELYQSGYFRFCDSILRVVYFKLFV